MKNIVLMLLILPALIVSCGSDTESEKILNFIPGTYARESEGEFGKSYDTLVISLQSKDAKQFKIVRRWRYDRVLDGKPIEPEYKVTETSGIYDASEKLLQESETLDVFTFDTKNKLLFNGANTLKKIK